MTYLIVQILWFLVAAAAIGFAVGWLCRSLAILRQRENAAMQSRAAQGELEGQRERLEARLAEAGSARKALEEEIARAREAAEANAKSLRKLEREHSSTLIRLEAREREVARLQAERGAKGEPDMPQAQASLAPQITPAPLGTTDQTPGTPPQGLAGPQGEADDLKRITGIGPGIEKSLHEAGIFHYRQIAELTPQNLAWIDHHLRLKGRAEREDWIGQARALVAEGGGLAETSSLVQQK